MGMYTEIESTLKTLIVDNVSGFTSDTVQEGNLDKAFKNAKKVVGGNAPFCVLYLWGGVYSEHKPLTFGGKHPWTHRTMIIFFIPVQRMDNLDQVEEDTRTVYEEFLYTIMHNTLNCIDGKKVVVKSVSPPRPVQEDKQAFYMLEVLVETIEEI